MKQVVVLLKGSDRMESLCSLTVRVSMESLINRSRKSGFAYVVHEDVQEWIDSGKVVDTYLISEEDQLTDLHIRASATLLCPTAVRDAEGKLIGVGIGPYQEGVLNSVIGEIKKYSQVN